MQVVDFIETHIASARQVQQLTEQQHCNGPQGSSSQKTQVSVEMLLYGLSKCREQMEGFPHFDVNMGAIVTPIV